MAEWTEEMENTCFLLTFHFFLALGLLFNCIALWGAQSPTFYSAISSKTVFLLSVYGKLNNSYLWLCCDWIVLTRGDRPGARKNSPSSRAIAQHYSNWTKTRAGFPFLFILLLSWRVFCFEEYYMQEGKFTFTHNNLIFFSRGRGKSTTWGWGDEAATIHGDGWIWNCYDILTTTER